MKQDRIRAWACAAAFALICLLTVGFLQNFTESDSPLLGELVWDTLERVLPSGETIPFSVEDWPVGTGEGEYIRLVGTLPTVGELPELYDPGGYILFETGNAEFQIFLNGEEYYYSHSPDQEEWYAQQVQLPIPPDESGGVLELRFRDTGEQNYPTCPHIRYSSRDKQSEFSLATANLYAIPAGAYALGFIIVCGLWLVSLAVRAMDWSVGCLALAAAADMLLEISTGSGGWFLPEHVQSFIRSDWFLLIPVALMALYLIRNWKRIWRYLVRVLAALTGFLLLWVLLSVLIPVVPFPRFLEAHISTFLNIPAGDFGGLLFLGRVIAEQITLIMLPVCAGVAAWQLLQEELKMRDQSSILALQNEQIMDNFERTRDSVQNTITMRHEWKHQVATLYMQAKRGDMNGLIRNLEQMNGELEQLSSRVYSRNFMINVILQNVAARAQTAGVSFTATAPVSEKLNINERDLCAFLFNLLDNALEAASRGNKRNAEIICHIQVQQNSFLIHCENTCSVLPVMDTSGRLKSTKINPENHGRGMALMQTIVEQYNGQMRYNYEDGRFTVEAVLHLPVARPVAEGKHPVIIT